MGRTIYARALQLPALVVRPKLRFGELWIAFLRLIAFVVIVVGIYVGAKQTYYSLGVSRIIGDEVDADLKLAFLGFFNKSLDVLLVSSLEYTASMTLTIWMARGGQSANRDPVRGVMFSDFGLKDELTKPWMALVSFATRWRRSKWSWKSLLRCLLCLCISLSVMLQGLAINTVAVPKQRWFPNYQHTWALTAQDQKTMTVEHPKTILKAIDWYNLLGVGQFNVGRVGYASWDWALGLSASLSFAGLTHIVSTVARPEKTWQHVYRMELDGDARRRWTGLNTAFEHSDRPVETLSVDDEQVTELFEWLRRIRHQPTFSSTGWTGNLTLVLPALNTICVSAVRSNSEAAFNVTVPNDATSGNPTFSINLGPVPSMNFTGATCSSTFRQASYPVNLWIVDMKEADVSFNGFGQDWDKHVVYEPIFPTDYDIVKQLAIQTRDSLPRIELLVPTTGLLPQFLLMSRMLQRTESAIQSDTAGLSVVLGVLLQNILSVSNKYRSPLPSTLPLDPSERTISYPLQWQLYGSGPRLAWEWITVIILAIVLLSFCFGIYQTVRYWISPGSWMELDGMMVLAQTSPPLKDIEDEDKARKRIYWVDKEEKGDLILKSKAV